MTTADIDVSGAEQRSARRPGGYSLLAPVMRAWHGSTRSQFDALPRPIDEPRGHAPGADPVRIFLLGSGILVGTGVRSHGLALPGQIARHLAGSTTRGVEVVSFAHRDMTVENAVEMLDDRPLGEFDAVVVVLGVSESLDLLPVGRWLDGLDAIEKRLRRDAPGRPVLFVGPHRIRSILAFDSPLGSVAQRHATRLNRTGERAIAHRRDTGWVVLPAGPTGRERHRTPEEYSQWGRLLSERVADLLDRTVAGWHDSDPTRRVPTEVGDRVARTRALEAFRALTEQPGPDLVRLVDLARRMFDTTAAAITLVDEQRQWVRVQSGGDTVDTEGVPIDQSICARTIEQDAVMVVPDVGADARFQGKGVADAIGFYAGYPLVSPDGHRLGALCVYDTEPRQEQDVDPTLLREIGMLTQRALWAAGRRPGAS
jgi:hypothetical protein